MLIQNTFTINSTLGDASNLRSKYCYDDTNTNMPIIVMMHGFRLTYDAITTAIMERIANQGFFVLAAGMRGRKGATGSPDASGREIHDIYDAINYVKANFPVSSDKVCISGYSGGGGNALAAATKFPDTFNVVVDHFGMSDYGYDSTYGWWYTNPSYQEDIENFIGDSPSSAPEKYLARAHVYGVKNFVGGELYAFHDSGDTNVSIIQSEYLETVLTGSSVDATFYYSGPSDPVRYLHSMDTSEITEPIWLPRASAVPTWEIANSGTIRVCGYIVTKKFKIFLGNYDDRTADVTYDLSTNSFTVTPLSPNTKVQIVKDGISYTTTINSTTTIVLNDKPSGSIRHYHFNSGGTIRKVKSVFFKENGAWKRSTVT